MLLWLGQTCWCRGLSCGHIEWWDLSWSVESLITLCSSCHCSWLLRSRGSITRLGWRLFITRAIWCHCRVTVRESFFVIAFWRHSWWRRDFLDIWSLRGTRWCCFWCWPSCRWGRKVWSPWKATLSELCSCFYIQHLLRNLNRHCLSWSQRFNFQ